MKILIVANYRKGVGGISGVVFNHLKKIKEEGYIVSIFNTKRNPFIRIFLILSLLIKIRKFNIIHVHGCSGLGFFPIVLGIIASKFFYNKKTIVTYHGGGAENFLKKHSTFIRKILQKADHVTVMSGFLQNIFLKYGINTTILPNLLNIEICSNNISDFTIPKIISVRALEKMYNIDDIIKAFSLIKTKYPKAELKILGNGSEYTRLFTSCKEQHITNVKFLGHLHNKLIPAELMKANIMISVPSFDNQPMSILEAFAIGIPVISSNVGGIPYLIKDNVTGFLVEKNHPEQIYEKVQLIINNPDKTKIIIENAKKEVLSFQWNNVKEILLGLYQSDLKQSK